ncbi:unnamed protein product, partial [Prorocentrum cordatum]
QHSWFKRIPMRCIVGSGAAVGAALGAALGAAFCSRAGMVSVAPLERKIDPLRCMGNWYVQVSIPTPFDRGAANGLEQYEWDEERQRVMVKYTFNSGSFEGKTREVAQVGRVHPESEHGTTWQVAPWLGLFYLPFWLDYIVIDIDDRDYSYMVCSSPSTGGLAPWMYISGAEGGRGRLPG